MGDRVDKYRVRRIDAAIKTVREAQRTVTSLRGPAAQIIKSYARSLRQVKAALAKANALDVGIDPTGARALDLSARFVAALKDEDDQLFDTINELMHLRFIISNR